MTPRRDRYFCVCLFFLFSYIFWCILEWSLPLVVVVVLLFLFLLFSESACLECVEGRGSSRLALFPSLVRCFLGFKGGYLSSWIEFYHQLTLVPFLLILSPRVSFSMRQIRIKKQHLKCFEMTHQNCKVTNLFCKSKNRTPQALTSSDLPSHQPWMSM